MKTIMYIVLCAAIVGGVTFAIARNESGGASATPEESAHIVLTTGGFEPREVTIIRGGTVTFSNATEKPFWPASNLHPTHGIYPEFDPKRPLQPDEEYSFTFERVGSHNFHDHIRAYFVGSVHVVAQ